MITNSFSVSSEQDLKIFLNNKKFNKIFILCGKKSYVKSGAKKLFSKILKKKTVNHYYKLCYYPEFVELKKIILAIKKFNPDLIIAVGGGSVLDYAKIANTVAFNENLDKKIINYSCVFKKKVAKLLAIPTTSGSGAEVTSNAVIYVNKIKYSVESEILKPDYFFLIPRFVIGASKKIKSSSGFDAIAQAIESLISKKSNLQSVLYAKKSLKISLKFYLDYLKYPNITNTSAMCIAANLSGKAINISKTTAPHAVSYPFTSMYNISHGHAVSLTLEKFLKFNYINSNKSTSNFNLLSRYESIFSLFNVKNIQDLEEIISQIKKKAGLESNFKKLGIDLNNNITKFTSSINLLRLKNNPINISQRDIKKILLSKDFNY